MPINLRINTEPARRAVKAFWQDVSKPAPLPFPVPQPPEKRKRERALSRSEELSRKRGAAGEMAAGAQRAGQLTSGLDEFEQGGFYNSLQDKFDAVKAGIDRNRDRNDFDTPENRRRTRDAADPVSRGQSLPGGLSAAVGGRTERSAGHKDHERIRSMIVERAVIKQVRGGGGLGGGLGSGGSGGSGDDDAPGSRRGSALAGLGAGIPIIGGIALAAGAILKTFSGLGQRYTAAMNSQSGTLGATGSYIGGGSGYFQNSEVAQASVAYGKASGKSPYGQRSPFSQREMQFAASQGMGLSEYGQASGELNRGRSDQDRISINFLRGATKLAGVLEMKQGEFVAGLGTKAAQNREMGYGNLDVRAYASLVAGISKSVSTPERGMTIADNLDTKLRAGDQGGMFGQLALAGKLSGGMDYFSALKSLETEGITADTMQGIDGMFGGNKDLRGYFMRREGISTMTEGASNLDFSGAPIQDDTSAIRAGFNQSTKMQNAGQEAITAGGKNGVGYMSAEMGYKSFEKTLETYKNPVVQQELKALATTIQVAEDKLLDVVQQGVIHLAKFAEDPEGMLNYLGEIIGTKIKEALSF